MNTEKMNLKGVEKELDTYLEWLIGLIQENPWVILILLFILYILWKWFWKRFRVRLMTFLPFRGMRTKIIRVVDGDTFIINNRHRENVRLIGIDTPESIPSVFKKVEPFGHEAARYTKKRLQKGQRVFIRYDKQKRDKYGRVLAYVYLANGEFLNKTLVEKGYAFTMRYPPNTRYAKLFEKLENKARRRNRGVWQIYDAKNRLKESYKRSRHYQHFKKVFR